MKKLVLSILALSLTAGSFAQRRTALHNQVISTDGETLFNNGTSALNTTIPAQRNIHPPSITTVSVTDIGHSANAFTCGLGAKTALFASPEINTVMMVFRNDVTFGQAAPATSGYLNYALSTDGGATWAADQYPLYNSNGTNAAPFANARYPMGGIYNPTGNTNPNNASIFYVSPSLTATNGTGFGGIVHGALNLTTGSVPTQTEILTDNLIAPYSLNIAPSTNKAYFAEAALRQASLTGDYEDTVAVYTGTWNTTTGEYDYVPSSVYFPVAGDTSTGKFILGLGTQQNGCKVAFAPNSNTGYMTIHGHPGFNFIADSVWMPMILKTIDGGATWTSIGALNMAGLSAVLPAATNYSVASENDLVVDANGNAHIIMNIGVSFNDFSVSDIGGDWGVFDVYSTGGGTAWFAQLLDKPKAFGFINGAATASPVQEFNRPQASTTWAGDKVFFTWFDTDTATFQTTDNSFPDAINMSLNVTTGLWSAPVNLTAGTAADGACSFGNVSPYVLGSTSTYTIPMSYMAIDNDNTTITTTHKYVSGLEITDAQFTVTGNPIALPIVITTGVNENHSTAVKSLLVYPNPASGRYNTLVFAMDKSSNVVVELVNTMGQLSKTVDYGMLNAGEQKLNLDVEGLQAGIYIVKIKAGDSVAVSKITVK